MSWITVVLRKPGQSESEVRFWDRQKAEEFRSLAVECGYEAAIKGLDHEKPAGPPHGGAMHCPPAPISAQGRPADL